MTFFVDLNCDLGEGAGQDAGLMPLVTSANIACGGHAGDFASMRDTVALALRHKVVIGAHPGFQDRENFGRKEMNVLPSELRQVVRDQIVALQAFGPVRHVKPHGALYNMAARDWIVAEAIVDAIISVDPSLRLYALAGSELLTVAQKRGLLVASEVFADRTYQKDGSLTPRSQENALLSSPAEAARQVLSMVREGVVRSTDGTLVPIVAETICLHGDGPHAVEFARCLNAELRSSGVLVKGFSPC